jgi:MarR family transcriptional regulator, lower aerobic nicotinate degradation pathway regulator
MPTLAPSGGGARRSPRQVGAQRPARSGDLVKQTAGARRVAPPPDVRTALDAFRRIVQALRVGRAGDGYGGLGSAQLFALQQIAEHPDASINDVAALTCTHQSSVSVVIQRLVRQRLVAKVASSQDRRRQRLAVTAKGWRLLCRAPVAVQEHLIAAIAALPAADRSALARSLSDVARRVAPDAAAPHPPMFFEDHADLGLKERRG